jgi:two-component system cell cycle sensor histidine kinase/response regulator CckA
LRDATGCPTSVLVINTDVTEKKKLQAQLHHAQRLEAIGVLASGVAHDFNNLLTIICGYSEMLQGQTRPSDPAHGMLSEILKAGNNATALTRQLLAFGRKQVLSPRILDPNGLVEESEKMLRRLIGPDIELTTKLDPGVGSIKVDPSQIDRVLINLVVNARDAMPVGGTIVVAVQSIEVDAEMARRHVGASPGPYVLLTVKDSGCGMDEATISRIFEPFFTTKEVGKGTGLGLAMVHGIVAQSGGHIEVESAPGKGTCFRIFLPRVEAAAVCSLGLPVAAFRGSETVLLVEDDAAVRELCRLTLRSSGYTVLEAANGEQALQVTAARSGRIHVLVTDSVMPRMSGRALTERLIRDHPNLKVVYISGHLQDAVPASEVAAANTTFLQKPFAPGTLASAVRELLGN